MKNKYLFGFLTLVSLLFVSINCTAQGLGRSDGKVRIYDINKNSIYVEFGGNAILSSVNYDRIIPFKDRTAYTLGIAVGLSGNIIPRAHLIFGGRKHFFDAGLGVKFPAIPFLDIGFSSDIFHIVPQIAYRFQGDFTFFKFSILYFRSVSPNFLDKNYPFVGLSYGYTF